MKKFLLACLLIIGLGVNESYGASKIVSTIKNIAQDEYNYQNNSAYSRDLAIVEEYLFGSDYRNDSIASRINRIERKLFNNTYPTMNNAQRMNNILSNYRNDYNRNYLSNYYNNTTPVQRIYNRFVGQPTGFTPPIMNMPFDSYGYPAGINRATFGNRGYRYNNFIPAQTGAGIHILD